MVLIPEGEYVLDSVLFVGPCRSSSIAFVLKGTIMPLGYTSNHEEWITFRYVSGLIVAGGGTLDAQGYKVWGLNDCSRSSNCLSLPVVSKLRFLSFSYFILIIFFAIGITVIFSSASLYNLQTIIIFEF